jgi:hypothetical protein
MAPPITLLGAYPKEDAGQLIIADFTISFSENKTNKTL